MKYGLYYIDEFGEWLKISDISYERFEKELIKSNNEYYEGSYACEVEYKKYLEENDMYNIGELDTEQGELIYVDGYYEKRFKEI